MKDLMGAHNYIKGQSFVQANKIGVIGFCWGGGKTFLFTTQNKDLAATVILLRADSKGSRCGQKYYRTGLG